MPSTNDPPKGGLHISLWVAQGLLAFAFGAAGTFKTFTPIAELGANMPWVLESPAAMVRFIGISELAGAIGLILPSALRILPRLTAAAAGGLLTIMALATIHHAVLGEFGALPVTFGLGGLAAFVMWGRGKAAVIPPR